DQVEDVARGLALAPELVARGRPEDRALRAQALAQRLGVGVGDEEHLARIGVLQDDRDHVLVALRNAPELLEVELRDGAFLEGVRLGCHVPYKPGLCSGCKGGQAARSERALAPSPR